MSNEADIAAADKRIEVALEKSAVLRAEMVSRLAPTIAELSSQIAEEAVKQKPARAQELGAAGLAPLKSKVASLTADPIASAERGLGSIMWIDVEVEPKRTVEARNVARYPSHERFHYVVTAFDPLQDALAEAGFARSSRGSMGDKIAWYRREVLAGVLKDLTPRYAQVVQEFVAAQGDRDAALQRQVEDAAANLWRDA